MTDRITPLEEHDGVLVKREDLYDPALPSGKLRGLVPYLARLRDDGVVGVVNAGATKSNSHLIVATAAARVGLQVATIVNSDRHHPATLAAREAGAEVILTQPMHLAPLKARAYRVAVTRSRYGQTPWQDLPWGLASQAIARHYAEAVRELADGQLVGRDPAIHVVPMGAAGWTVGVYYGVQLYRPRDLVYAVPVMPTNERNDTRRILALLLRHRDGQLPRGLELHYSTRTEATPWPSDPAYEHVAWPLARHFADRERGFSRVVFWSIGQALR